MGAPACGRGERPATPVGVDRGEGGRVLADALHRRADRRAHLTTVPDSTLDAFRHPDAPPPRATVLEGVDEAREQLAELARAGVDLDDVTDQLERDGVEQFSRASERMIEAIARKRERVGV